MNGLLPALLLALAGGSGDVQRAWWLTLAPEANDTHYRGRPVSDWHPDLAAASPLRCDGAITMPAAGQCAEIRDNGAAFQLRRDFDGDGGEDVAEVLVGRLRDGTPVGVLALAPLDAPGEGRAWLVRDHALSFLYPSMLGLRWYLCMECDNGWEVHWDGHYRDYIFVDLVPPEMEGSDHSG